MAARDRTGSSLPGSYRGTPPRVGGTGSGQGPAGAFVNKITRPGWSPTVGNLVVLIALEIAAYCALRWAFRTAHGG